MSVDNSTVEIGLEGIVDVLNDIRSELQRANDIAERADTVVINQSNWEPTGVKAVPESSAMLDVYDTQGCGTTGKGGCGCGKPKPRD